MSRKTLPSQEEFSSLYLKLRYGEISQRIEWMANLPKEYAVCLECKLNPKRKCDQRSVVCISCRSNDIDCPRLAHFIRETMMKTFSIPRDTYLKFLKRHNGDPEELSPPPKSEHDSEEERESDSSESPELESLLEPVRSSSLATLVPDAMEDKPDVGLEREGDTQNEDLRKLDEEYKALHNKLFRKIKSSSDLQTKLADAQTKCNDLQKRLDDTELSLKRALADAKSEATLRRRFRNVLESSFATSAQTNSIQILFHQLVSDVKDKKLSTLRKSGPGELLERLDEIQNELGDLAARSSNSQDERTRTEYLKWVKSISSAHVIGRDGTKKRKRAVEGEGEFEGASSSTRSGSVGGEQDSAVKLGTKRRKVRKSKNKK